MTPKSLNARLQLTIEYHIIWWESETHTHTLIYTMLTDTKSQMEICISIYSNMGVSYECAENLVLYIIHSRNISLL